VVCFSGDIIEFYQKLSEKYYEDDELSDDDFGTLEETPLNSSTLVDYIHFTIIDYLDLWVVEVLNLWKQDVHPTLYSGYQELEEYLINEYEEINKQSKRDWAIKEPLSDREKILIKFFCISEYSKHQTKMYKEYISTNYKVSSNENIVNQQILNNSYDVIITELKTRFSTVEEVTALLEQEKLLNQSLFTNLKKLTQMKKDNHYMSFLFMCDVIDVGKSPGEKVVFKEFVEALVKGYEQYISLQNRSNELKILKRDLQTLEKYNEKKENDKNIKKVKTNIIFYSAPKAHHKFIPFKVLADTLNLETKQMANYISNVLNSNKLTINLHFDTLTTMLDKKVSIGRY